MQQLQDVFNRIQESKKKKKDLETAYKDALNNSMEYQDVVDKLKAAREKKKQIEATIREQFSSELTQIEDLKIDIASDMEMLSDIAMTQMMKGETVEVKDSYDNVYAPVFKVSFKKSS